MFTPTEQDREQVAALLGRSIDGDFEVVTRDRTGLPVVIKNAPFLKDGTPMPTLFWLVGKKEREAVSRLESAGQIKLINESFSAEEIAEDHLKYFEERNKLIPSDYVGPLPEGGVGGTRRGVKCLHAHLASYLAGQGDRVGRYCAKLLSGEIDGPVAGIDCGSNSTRLLILAPDGTPLLRKMQITRLGQGVDRSGSLSEEAVERTLASLVDYRSLMDNFGVVRVRAIATSAVRDAVNARDFLERVSDILDSQAEILSGIEEGNLAYKGATADLDGVGEPYLMVDIGGGSTEMVTGNMGKVTSLTSLNIGCVRITERFLQMTDQEKRKDSIEVLTAVKAARSHIRQLLEETIREFPLFSKARSLVAVAGTVSALARADLKIKTHDEQKTHHHVLKKEFVEEMAKLLPTLSLEERVTKLYIEEARADVILGGVLILEQIMDILEQKEALVSEKDILDATASSLL